MKRTQQKTQRPDNARIQITVFGSFWFSMVLFGNGFINYLASESFVVSFSYKTENFELFDRQNMQCDLLHCN